MRRFLLLAIVTAVAGCTAAQPTYLANGAPAQILTCALGVDSINRCYRTAGQLCGARGFMTYDWQGKPIAMPHTDPNGLEAGANLEPVTILVACRS